MVNLEELTKREIIEKLHEIGEERCEQRLMRQNKDSLIRLHATLLKMKEIKEIEEECESDKKNTLSRYLILSALLLCLLLLSGV